MTNVELSYRGATGRLLVLAVGLFLAGTNSFVIAGLLPAIATDLQVSTRDLSFTITGYALVIAVAAPALSIALARRSRTLLMAVGLLVFSAGAALSALAPTFALFAAGRLLAGLGAAALVPTATAAAAALVPAPQRGRALALVATGFTLATAVGSPLGTALGAAQGWRAPIVVLALAGMVVAGLTAVTVRNVPAGSPTGLRARLAPLRRRSIATPLLTTLLMIAAFNLVYIFSAEVTADATAGSGSRLAVLLFAYGVAGVIGNLIAGPLTDRLGSGRTGGLALALHAVALLLVLITEHVFVAAAAAFAFWGLTAFACAIPVQHRLAGVDPTLAPITLSWYSTAMYVGIALAPVIAAGVVGTFSAAALPLAGAVVCLLALAAFAAGFSPRPVDDSPGRSAAAA